MMEAGVLLGLNMEPLHWHTPNDRSGGALPDSRTLWDVIWENRHRVGGFAHTHPGFGVPGPSGTDLTTFAAIEEGLGIRLEWFILSGDRAVIYYWDDVKYVAIAHDASVGHWPWMAELRRLSGFGVQNPNIK